MLEDSICTFDEALLREKFYANQETSGYEAKETDRKIMKRQHALNKQTIESEHCGSEMDKTNFKKMRTQELTSNSHSSTLNTVQNVRNKDNHDENLSFGNNINFHDISALSRAIRKDRGEIHKFVTPQPLLHENVSRLRSGGNLNVSSNKAKNQVNEEINQHVVQGNKNSSENDSLGLLLAIHKEMVEIKAVCITERSERMEMEARIQSNVDICMATILSKSRSLFVTNDLDHVRIDNPVMENLAQKLSTCYEKDQKLTDHTIINSQDNQSNNRIITTVHLDKEKETSETIPDLTDESNLRVQTENENKKGESESDSESESEYDPDWMNTYEVTVNQSNAQCSGNAQLHIDPNSKSDCDSESDPESDTDSQPLPSKPKTVPQKMKLTCVGEHFYDENGFMYSKNNVGPNNSLYLRCRNSVKHQCPARAKVMDGDLQNAVLTILHKHKSEKKFIDKAKFYVKLDERCRLDPFEKPQKLYLDSKADIIHLVDEGYIPSLKQSTTFIRTRLTQYVPPLPKTIEQFEALIAQDRYQKKFGLDIRNLPFFRGVWTSSESERSIAFVSETVLKLINTMNNVTLFMDGTFKALPYHMQFGQLYVINFIYKNHCYPLAYILMEKRSFTAYDSVFTNLKLLMPSVDVAKLMTDYEPATRKSLRINYPNARLSGCFFHYVQAIYKNAKRFGLLNDPKFKQVIQKVSVLALLPNEFVVPGFNLIDEKFLRKKSKRWTKFRNYWRGQWASANISVYALVDRTNNFSESSNKTINSLLKRTSPTIWELLNTLRKIEMDKSDEIKNLAGQMKTTQKKLNMIRLNEKIQMATKLFEQTQDIGSFLENVTYDENYETYIKDDLDIDDKDTDYDEVIIPNSLNIESDFRQRHLREARAK